MTRKTGPGAHGTGGDRACGEQALDATTSRTKPRATQGEWRRRFIWAMKNDAAYHLNEATERLDWLLWNAGIEPAFRTHLVSHLRSAADLIRDLE